MSLGIAFKGPEGIVLAADSRVTLMAIPQQQAQPGQAAQPGQQPTPLQIPVTYDNATKMLNVTGQTHVGAVTYGLGAFGTMSPRTIHSYIPEFEAKLAEDGVQDRLTVSEFARRLSDFFMERWQEAGMPMPPNHGQDIVFLVGGYDEDEAYGHVYEVYIPSRPQPNEQHADNFGMVWGGQREYTDRLIQGFDEAVPHLTQQHLGLTDPQRDGLRQHLRQNLQAPIPFPFLPLQDCVDVAIFLIRTTISLHSWLIGVRGVGGAIDVATITRTEGFHIVQKKEIRGER